MEVEELNHAIEEAVEHIDHNLYSDASIQYIDEAIELLQSLKNTIQQNL